MLVISNYFKKVFDSLNHVLLIVVLEKYRFGHDFIWIKILLKNQKSCVMNCGGITHYFNLERDTRQGDPILAYLFIQVLEIFEYTYQIQQKYPWYKNI